MAVKKLLVADDSLTIQKVIRLALSGAAAAGSSQDGYNIQAVSDGNDAIQQISLFRPDIVLIDVSLPGKTAFEVKRAINEHPDLAAIRFILMSSAFEKVDEEQAQEVAFHGRLTKPFDPAHLREVLLQVLAQLPEKGNGAQRVAQDEPTVFLNAGATALAETLPIPDPPPFPLQAAPAPDFHESDWQTDREQPAPPEFPMPEDPTPAFQPDRAPPPPARGVGPAPSLASPNFHTEIPIPDPHDSDIRELTETTLQLGSSDELGWSVQEHLLKPPSQLADIGDSTFPVGPPPPAPQPLNPWADELSPAPNGIHELQHPASQAPPPLQPGSQGGAALSSAFPESAPPPPPRLATSPPVSTERMQEAIRHEVTEALKKMVQDLLPELAERIIKQEIRRMLSDPT